MGFETSGYLEHKRGGIEPSIVFYSLWSVACCLRQYKNTEKQEGSLLMQSSSHMCRIYSCPIGLSLAVTGLDH